MRSVNHIDLTGAWIFRKKDEAEWLPATVPGCVHLDLMAAGRIGDPFYREEEKDCLWIGETEWVYARTFDAPEALCESAVVRLRCEGLDSLATVYLNNYPIGQADNMFRIWELDMKPALRLGENRLEIAFASPLHEMARRQKERFLFSVGGDKRIEPEGRSWIRKEPCNFGWDWAPVCITCGIWRPLEILAFSMARIADLHIRQRHRDDSVQLETRVEVERSRAEGAPLWVRVRVTFDEREIHSADAQLEGSTITLPIQISNPQLWWPAEMGNQPLYAVEVELRDGEGELIDRVQRRIGLRRMAFVRRPDEWGESLYFEVNGVPFFAKGANWVPADVFAPRVGRRQYERLLRDAAAAHMNFLRVWGGGIYEAEDFYDLCDELGICVWQEFMFACAAYPAHDSAFVENVRREVRDVVRRLRHHPCIALYCGNNELEHLRLVNADGSEGRMSWAEYDHLFHKVLPDVLQECDPDTSYWPSSSHNPLNRHEANSPTAGDAHLWEVWHERRPFEWYRTSTHRFCSEFGLQSFPHPLTVAAYTAEEDRNIASAVMEHHQRHGQGNVHVVGEGNSRIMEYMLSWFKMPVGFENTLWLSQIQHAVAMKYAVEHWRTLRPRTMGALYWQLNDCWPVASGSSLDYFGRWKALHYMARRFFAPLHIATEEDAESGRVKVFIMNDYLQPRLVRWTWLLTDTAGRSIAQGEAAIRVPPNMAIMAEELDLSHPLEAVGPPRVLLWLELFEDGRLVSENCATFVRPKYLELLDPCPRNEVRQIAPGVFHSMVQVEKPALWTWVQLQGVEARYSDNFFCLLPGRQASVEIRTTPDLSLRQLHTLLRTKTLFDTFKEEAARGLDPTRSLI